MFDQTSLSLLIVSLVVVGLGAGMFVAWMSQKSSDDMDVSELEDLFSEDTFGKKLKRFFRCIKRLFVKPTPEELADRKWDAIRENPENYKGEKPDNSGTFTCDLKVPGSGKIPEGIIYESQDMSEKWDVFFYGRYLYFTRSWTGELIYKAKTEIRGIHNYVISVEYTQDWAPCFPVDTSTEMTTQEYFKPLLESLPTVKEG